MDIVPTLPGDAQELANGNEEAKELPRKHCCFHDCSYTCTSDTELIDHWENDHLPWNDALIEAVKNIDVFGTRKEKIFAVMNRAIAERIRQGAPFAHNSVNRRCLKEYH